jgi:hypothetical protein
MTSRIYIAPARIIVSRPGFTVGAGMPDSQKIFDSDWNWSGILLEAGAATDPGGSTDWNLMFKKNYGYPPCVVAKMLSASPGSVPWAGPDVTSPMDVSTRINQPVIYSDRIIFPRVYLTGGNINYGNVEYEVYGVD